MASFGSFQRAHEAYAERPRPIEFIVDAIYRAGHKVGPIVEGHVTRVMTRRRERPISYVANPDVARTVNGMQTHGITREFVDSIRRVVSLDGEGDVFALFAEGKIDIVEVEYAQGAIPAPAVTQPSAPQPKLESRSRQPKLKAV